MCKEMRLLNMNGINFPARQAGRYICTAFITQRNNSVDKKVPAFKGIFGTSAWVRLSRTLD